MAPVPALRPPPPPPVPPAWGNLPQPSSPTQDYRTLFAPNYGVPAGQWPWWIWRPDPQPPPPRPWIDWWWGIPPAWPKWAVYVRLRPHYAYTRIPAYTNDDRMMGRGPWWRQRAW